ncbi:hypothetical protein SIN8267_02381 [Sinobacterium norvegicum]|uniref:Uncharacterized protein n=1 Tax=Sinobacterium norvegicum TaxID=1641715 RepID=A0ABM9AGK5_9GAMM|nr:hypothetical protein SIN8267_02381 [Sinobacterium norvegicum]
MAMQTFRSEASILLTTVAAKYPAAIGQNRQSRLINGWRMAAKYDVIEQRVAAQALDTHRIHRRDQVSQHHRHHRVLSLDFNTDQLDVF